MTNFPLFNNISSVFNKVNNLRYVRQTATNENKLLETCNELKTQSCS